MDLAERNSLIEFYFRLGLTYVEIFALLACRHNYVFSERSLHRLLRERDLYRRRNQSDLLDVACFIEEQLCQSGGLHGYRWMHGVCTQAGFTISKEHVRLLLTILDSRGVAIRASRRLRRREYNAQGPSNLWHFDGYDKLKPYGRVFLKNESLRTMFSNPPLHYAGHREAVVKIIAQNNNI